MVAYDYFSAASDEEAATAVGDPDCGASGLSGLKGAEPTALWRVIEGIGGENGWYSFPLAWAARGWLDRLVGGVGLRRGRRDARRLPVGDSLDFWRVEEIEPGRLLRLRAEMRLPGLAWLELRADRDADGGTRYRQRALFHPRGLLGQLYWWSVTPWHALVFGGMARNIARAAERAGPAPTAPPAAAAVHGHANGGHANGGHANGAGPDQTAPNR
jgi:hypothetical protein